MTKIPTNRAEAGKIIYVSDDVLQKLASYEDSKRAYEKGLIVITDYFWYDNSHWDKNEPIGIMTASDALESEDTQGCSFIEFDSTIPAFTHEQLKNFNNV